MDNMDNEEHNEEHEEPVWHAQVKAWRDFEQVGATGCEVHAATLDEAWDRAKAWAKGQYDPELGVTVSAPKLASLQRWTPAVLMAYDRYRVCAADGSLPMVALRLDGWQVGAERWCLSTEEACHVLNDRGATPVAIGRFMRGSGEAGHDGLDLAGHPAQEQPQEDNPPQDPQDQYFVCSRCKGDPVAHGVFVARDGITVAGDATPPCPYCGRSDGVHLESEQGAQESGVSES